MHHALIFIVLAANPVSATPADPRADAESPLPEAVAVEPTILETPILTTRWYSSAEILIGTARIQSGYGPEPRLGGFVAPEFQLGYQFESGRSIHADFRFFGASGKAPIQPGTMWSYNHKVYGQVLDLDFRFRESDWSDTLLLPFLRTRWEVGLRAANFYLETREPMNTYDGWTVGAIRSDSFTGLGPHFDYRLSIPIPVLSLVVFTEVDLALLWGRRNQRLEPTAPYIVDTNQIFWGERTPYNKTRGTDGSAGQAQWRVGLSWGGPLFGRRVRLTGGYVADYWAFHSFGHKGGGFMSWSGRPSIQSSQLNLGGGFLQLNWTW